MGRLSKQYNEVRRYKMYKSCDCEAKHHSLISQAFVVVRSFRVSSSITFFVRIVSWSQVAALPTAVSSSATHGKYLDNAL